MGDGSREPGYDKHKSMIHVATHTNIHTIIPGGRVVVEITQAWSNY